MQPSVTRTRNVTSSDGTTEKTGEPMIMERYEAVIVPTEAKVTTTTVRPVQRIAKKLSRLASAEKLFADNLAPAVAANIATTDNYAHTFTRLEVDVLG